MKSCFSTTAAKKNRALTFGMMKLSSSEKFDKRGASKEYFVDICACIASIIEKDASFLKDAFAQ